jgi:hypothetical protein
MDDLIAFLRARLDDDEMDVDMMVATSSDRWLAEVAAKRAIVELILTEVDSMEEQLRQEFGTSDDPVRDWVSDRLLRHLAAVYADHPDYRAEWRPVADRTAQE